MMSQLPYCANISVTATSCDLGIPNTDFIGSDFITSINGPTTITYKYTNNNGELVSISTNLEYTLDTKNKTFTLSNNNIFETNEIPSIELCCNEVKVPIIFIDSDGTGNKWYSQSIETNDITLKGIDTGSEVKIAKFCKVSWNKTTEQTIFLDRKQGSNQVTEYYACVAYYGYLNGSNFSSSQTRMLSINGSSPLNKKFIIPRLDGVESTLKGDNNNTTKKFKDYFMLGVQVKISDGWSIYKNNTKFYINGTNIIYDNTGILKTIAGKKYLITENFFPKILTKNNSKWNSKFFFTTQKDSNNKSYYISPSTSIIKIEYNFDSKCPLNCPCDSNCECDDHAEVFPCPQDRYDYHDYCWDYYDCKNYSYFDQSYQQYDCYTFCSCYDEDIQGCGGATKCNTDCECYGYVNGDYEYQCLNYSQCRDNDEYIFPCRRNNEEDIIGFCECNAYYYHLTSDAQCDWYCVCYDLQGCAYYTENGCNGDCDYCEDCAHCEDGEDPGCPLYEQEGSTYIRVGSGGTTGQFLITEDGNDYLVNCSVQGTLYGGYELEGGGALIYGHFIGKIKIGGVTYQYSSYECSITSNYTVVKM